MRASIRSGVGIAWASRCCDEAFTSAGAIGPKPTADGFDGLAWSPHAERVVVEDYLLAIDRLEAGLLELDARLSDIAQTEPYREPVGWLRCFRGINTLTAMLIRAELHDVRRFPSGRALMAYVGLVLVRTPRDRSTEAAASRARVARWSAGCWRNAHGTINIGRGPAPRSLGDGSDDPDA